MSCLKYLTLCMVFIILSCSGGSQEKIPVKTINKNENTEPKNQEKTLLDKLIKANNLNPDLKVQSNEQWKEYEDHNFDITGLGDLNCAFGYLFVKKGEKIANVIEIKKECDSDLSFYQYERFDYRLSSDTIFIIKVREEVLDKSVLDIKGFIKNGIERSEQASLKIDTSYFYATKEDLLRLRPSWPKVILPEIIMKKSEGKVAID